MERILSVLIGAVIAAAFLGPGTITTAARAGASHGAALLWTLLFASIACFVLQEASARLTIVSGRPLARALRRRYDGPTGTMVLVLVVGAVILGCAAYQAGNILGGVAGAELATGVDSTALTLVSATLAGLLLWSGNTRWVVSCLGALVAVMGVAFCVTAVRVGPQAGELTTGLLVPSLPDSSGLLVLGLIGTTVVPYNLFLGSGLASGQSLAGSRFGLALAIGLGGLVSMAVVVVGSALSGEFSFAALAGELDGRLGSGAGRLFGWGLFAAGFSSAVTAPLAAAITARGLFSEQADDPSWQPRSWRFRSVWLLVLAVGVGFGISGVRPVPVIILAQALNGVLLPLVAFFLWLAVNDRRLMSDRVNGTAGNFVMAVVVGVSTCLGVRGCLRAAAAVTEAEVLSTPGALGLGSAVAFAIGGLWAWRERRAQID